MAWAPRAAAGAAPALVVVETQSLSPSRAAIERHHTGENRRAPAHAAPTRGHLGTPWLAPRVAGPPARPHLTVTQLVDGEAPSMGSPAPGEPGPPSSGTPVPACVPPPSCRMPHRRGRARRPVHSRARPAAPLRGAHAPQQLSQVRLSRRRCGAARREALGASRLASTARVRPPQPVPVRPSNGWGGRWAAGLGRGPLC